MLVTLVIFSAALVLTLFSLSAAKSRIMQANMQLEGNRIDDVEPTLQAAEKFMTELTDAEKAPLLAGIAEIRAKLAGTMKPEDARKITGARGKIRQVLSQIESRQTLGAEDNLKVAEQFLDGLSNAHKAEVVAEIAAVRAQLAAGAGAFVPMASTAPREEPRASGAAPAVAATTASAPAAPASAPAAPQATSSPAATPAPTTAAPAATAPTAVPAAAVPAADAMSEDVAAMFTRAKGHLSQAKSALESGRLENIAHYVGEAEHFLKTVPESHKAPLMGDIRMLREKLAESEMAEKAKRIESEISRHVRAVESFLEYDIRAAGDAVQRVARRLEDDDSKEFLSAESIQQFKDTLAAAKLKVAEKIKQDVLERAGGLMAQIDELLVDDPFAGKDEREVYNVYNKMEGLGKSVTSYLKELPDGDADVLAMQARLTAAEQKIAAASTAWSKAQVHQQVAEFWGVIKNDVAGWEEESVPADAPPLQEPSLPKTWTVIRRINYWLDDNNTKKIREEHKGDPTLEAIYAEARRTFDTAADKLNAAFNKVLDAADKMPTPMRSFDLDRANMLAVSAENTFAGTKYLEPNVARARALDARWKAEVAAVMASRQALYDKLAAEAETKWPAIVAALAPVASFDPTDAGLRGKTILLAGVYNRSGWDFSGRDYSFAMRHNGIPLGGNYEPHVLAALEHAWYELKLDVNDRIRWDVIAVVEGPGKIGERTQTIVRDRNNMEIGKIEEYPAVDCVRLRVIALHAGPVAVGAG